MLAFSKLHSAGSAGTNGTEAKIVVLHGVTGQATVFKPFVQELIDRSAAASGRPVTALIVDQRGHGDSKNLPFDPPHTVDTSTDDVLALLRHELGTDAAPTAILGHSLGGKVALNLLQRMVDEGAPLPRQVWVVDAAVGTTEPDVFSMLRTALQALSRLEQPVESPLKAKEVVVEAGIYEGAAEYLASRFQPDPAAPGRYRSGFNPSVALDLLESYCPFNLIHLMNKPPSGVQLHLVMGSASTILDGSLDEKPLWLEGLAKEKQDGTVQFWQVPDAMHFVPWTHPVELAAVIAPALAAAM